MIYTVGNTQSYEAGFKEAAAKGIPLMKLDGGSVWETEAEARAYLKANSIGDAWSVYGVLAEWGKDTKITEHNTAWRSLKRDAELVQL